MSKELAPKGMDPRELQKLVAFFPFETEPDLLFERIARKLTGPNKDGSFSHDDLRVLVPNSRELKLAGGIGGQYTIVDTVGYPYGPMVVTIARQFIAEYKCQTPSEMAMAEIAAVSYVQFVDASKQMRIHINNPVYDRKVDKAHKQFMSALDALRRMKTPPTGRNVVTAQNAFLAQNQINTVSNTTNNKPRRKRSRRRR